MFKYGKLISLPLRYFLILAISFRLTNPDPNFSVMLLTNTSLRLSFKCKNYSPSSFSKSSIHLSEQDLIIFEKS